MKALFAALAALLAMACGQAAQQVPAAKPTAAVTATPASAPPTTDKIMALLKTSNLPISGYTVYTAETDANHLLGRPSQYIAKMSWHDSRIPDQPLRPEALAVDDGGGVEIFANTADRDLRLNYLATVAKQPLFAEYDYPIGSYTLLRVGRKLTPTQGQEYQQALASL